MTQKYILNDVELTAAIKELAVKLYPSANEWAVKEGCKNVIRFLENVNPGEYNLLYHSLYVKDASVKEYENICTTKDRLERLAMRLENDGFYTDANICWLALKELK